ncbi:MAG: HD domain-containing protein [Desulfobulbaceae bacterium]|nr:HD domain-containing protein [Desulfobulbaceae bacterium]
MTPHNIPLGTEKTAALRSISAGYCEAEGGSHGPDHSERVYTLSLVMGRELQARQDILAAAALLHDIGRRYETESRGGICHARKGAEMAATILKNLDFSPPDIAEITHCIKAHRFRSTEKPATLEARILFDADKLDSIGAVGIGRAFLFAGRIGAKLHDAEADHTRTLSYSSEDTAYREFQIKMSRVREQMLTPLGRQFAESRHQFMEIFFDQLNREIYGLEKLARSDAIPGFIR